jgi:hypothetical protein
MEENKEWNSLTHDQKNHVLFLREKELLDVLLEHGAPLRWDLIRHPACVRRRMPPSPKGKARLSMTRACGI